MIRIALAAVASLALVATAAADKSFVDNNLSVSHDCSKDAAVTVSGNNGTFTLTGACTAVHVRGNNNTLKVASTTELGVEGNGNTVAVDAADAITTTGNNNTVTW
jgi:hypothetical protein